MNWSCINKHPGRRKFVSQQADGRTYVVLEVHGGWMATEHGPRGGLKLKDAPYLPTAHACREWCEAREQARKDRR